MKLIQIMHLGCKEGYIIDEFTKNVIYKLKKQAFIKNFHVQ